MQFFLGIFINMIASALYDSAKLLFSMASNKKKIIFFVDLLIKDQLLWSRRD